MIKDRSEELIFYKEFSCDKPNKVAIGMTKTIGRHRTLTLPLVKIGGNHSIEARLLAHHGTLDRLAVWNPVRIYKLIKNTKYSRFKLGEHFLSEFMGDFKIR